MARSRMTRSPLLFYLFSFKLVVCVSHLQAQSDHPSIHPFIPRVEFFFLAVLSILQSEQKIPCLVDLVLYLVCIWEGPL